MLEANDLKKGVFFKYRNRPYQVVDFSHTHKGRGGATVTVKVKDLTSSNVLTLTFKGGEKIEDADIGRKPADFLYKEENAAYFMETDTYEQIALSDDRIKGKLHFLKEGQEVTILTFESQPIDIELSPKVELKVIEAEPGVKGDTASGTAYKQVKLESGYVLNVPLFVKQDDVIRVNTETGEYVERVS